MSSVMKKILAKWQSYRYRFVPWVAWNLRERTVRSVENANQDKIISDHLVKETYVKLFSALEGNLPYQDRGEGHKLQGTEMERNSSKVNIRVRRSDVQDDGGNIRYFCHDKGTLGSHDEQIAPAKTFFGRTCKLSWGQKCGSTWTCRNSGGNYNGGDCLGTHQHSLAQRLMQYWTSHDRESLKDNFKDCGDIRRRNKLLIRNLLSTGTWTSSGFENRGCSYHHYCHPALSVHSPSHNQHNHHHHHHHHHRHHHHHHSYCHHSDQSAQKFLKQKNISNSAQLTQQRFSTHPGQSKGNQSDTGLGEDLDPGAIIMHQTLGYAIGRRPSQIEGGGIGVYVIKGVVPKGVVVAMYPGTIYYPAEPILFQSIANPFVFRCLDGIHIDGNDKRLSKMIYRSCARRDRLGPCMFSDLSWLTSCPLNPMAVGQYVNNQHKGAPANVCYQEFDVPVDFPLKLRKYIPNTFYSTLPNVGNAGRSVRTVALVSLREIQCGEELLSSYFTLIY